MPSIYEIALMLVRLFAGMNVAVGMASLVVSIAGAFYAVFEHIGVESLFAGVMGYLLDYGAAALLGGIAMLALSRRIARYASKG